MYSAFFGLESTSRRKAEPRWTLYLALFTYTFPGKVFSLSGKRIQGKYTILSSSSSFQALSAGKESGDRRDQSECGRCCEGQSDSTVIDQSDGHLDVGW
jgi:hypothetical protein